MKMEEIVLKAKQGSYDIKTKEPTVKFYSADHVFDEDKSVKWNREEIERLNILNSGLRAEYENEKDLKLKEFEKDVISFILKTYSHKTSDNYNIVREYLSSFTDDLFDIFK